MSCQVEHHFLLLLISCADCKLDTSTRFPARLRIVRLVRHAKSLRGVTRRGTALEDKAPALPSRERVGCNKDLFMYIQYSSSYTKYTGFYASPYDEGQGSRTYRTS